MDETKDLEFETGFTETKFGWGKDRIWPCGCKAYMQRPFKQFVVSHYCDAHYAKRLVIVQIEGVQ